MLLAILQEDIFLFDFEKFIILYPVHRLILYLELISFFDCKLVIILYSVHLLIHYLL